MVYRQLYYTISGEELFVFKKQKMPYLYGLWCFANAYLFDLKRGVLFPDRCWSTEIEFPKDFIKLFLIEKTILFRKL